MDVNVQILKAQLLGGRGWRIGVSQLASFCYIVSSSPQKLPEN